ncbi:MAG: hypothetical protein JSW06_11420 [Thermoplasmatales archaeon]|nr:MAG: hypothetical protein JSW06_11420 [Thermoplasmatales archaeon]
MRFKKEFLIKDRYYNKFLSSFIIILMVIASLSIIFIDNVTAQGSPNVLTVFPSSQNVTIGDTIYTLINVSINWEINNITISNITFEPAGILNYTSTTIGDVFSGGSWWTPDSNGTIVNASGYAYNLTWINDIGTNGTSADVANITWYTNNIGTVNINLTGTTKNNTGVNHTTNNQNVTICVYPQGTTSFSATTLTDTQIRLNFTHGIGADRIHIQRMQGMTPPMNITDGTFVCNVTGTSYVDSNLIPGTTYSYSAWGWNSTENLNSLMYDATGINTYQGGSGWFLQEHYSDVTPRHIENGTEQKFNFSFVSETAGPTSRLHNLTIILPQNLTYIGNNGTTVQNQADYTVYNTSTMIVWNATDYANGFLCDGTKYFWFNASALGPLESLQFQIIAYNNYSEFQSFYMGVFITTNFSFTGSVMNINGNTIQGAIANVTVSSFTPGGPPVTLGYFTANTNATGHFNVTGIPTTEENISGLQSGPMGPGGGGDLFYSLSATEYEPTSTYAINISTSLPSLPIGEFVTMLNNPEIYLKPAISFRVNTTGPNYNWSSKQIDNYSANRFQIMVKDLRLGFSVKEQFTNSYEKVFSVPAARNYSLSIFPDQSFPVSIRFYNITSTCEASGDFNITGVNTTCMPYNGTYLVNVSVNVSYNHRWLNGSFNGITDIEDMKVVAYIMEDQDMIFENWALPFNLANESGGSDDSYNTTTGVYNISLPATMAPSYIMLRAYSKNSSGVYYMGSHILSSSGGNLNESTYNFTMSPLINGITRLITSNNVSAQWNQTVIANTTAVLFNLVNSTGSLLSNENAFIDIKRELDGVEYMYMVDAQSGQFNISITQGSSLKKLTIYSQQYAPVSTYVSSNILSGIENTTTISSSNGICNITMRSFGNYDPLGENASFSMEMYKSNNTCNVPNPPSYCSLCEGMNKTEFSPFNAILKGDVSMMISSGNISVYYINVDLLASGPPDAAFSQNATETAGGFEAAWQFGSQGPDIYDEVLIMMPYPDSLVNKTINVSIPVLYDNEFNVIWNASTNTTSDILTNDALSGYRDYLNTPYEAYLNGSGVICNESDRNLSSGLGYIDTVNQTIWIKIPHFSGVGPKIGGEYVPDLPSSFTATKSGTSQIGLTWTMGNKADYIRIQKKTDSYPINISDGTNVYNSTGTSKSDTSLSAGTTYYYSAWSWNNTEKLWSTSYATSSATTDTSGGGPPGGGTTPTTTTTEDNTTTTDIEAANTTNDEIENMFGVNLTQSFYANDTNGDGILELNDFDDPNGILSAERLVNISGNSTFLISVYGSMEDIFIWDASADTITEVTYVAGTITSSTIDTENDIITVTVSVNKSNWIYIEINDEYPDISNLVVKTLDNRIIASDMIFRENGKVFVLDDPDTTYMFDYHYTILSPTFDPVSGTAFKTLKPTITIAYNENVTVIEATLNDETIILTTLDDRVFTYTPDSNLTNNNYVLSVTVKDNVSNIRNDIASYTVEVEKSSEDDQGITALLITIFVILAIIVLVIFLFKNGYLYIERE